MDWINFVVMPAVFGLGVLVVWLFKSEVENLRAAEANLHLARHKIYMEILEPYIVTLTAIGKDDISMQDKATETMLSLDYRRVGFELSLIGSDSVVRAYNEMMQEMFKNPENSGDTIRLLGEFLVEIRKSLGNRNTNLKPYEMFEWILKDVREKTNEPLHAD